MKTKAFIVRLMSPNVIKEISRVISSNKFLSKMTDLNIFALATQKYTIVPCQLLASSDYIRHLANKYLLSVCCCSSTEKKIRTTDLWLKRSFFLFAREMEQLSPQRFFLHPNKRENYATHVNWINIPFYCGYRYQQTDAQLTPSRVKARAPYLNSLAYHVSEYRVHFGRRILQFETNTVIRSR